MKKIKNIVLEGTHGKPILTDVFFNEESAIKPKPVVIFCHGYKGFKDWGYWDLVAAHFASASFLFVKFNFSYNGGTIEEPIDFPDLEAFGQNNYSKELDDLKSVLDWIVDTNNNYHSYIDTAKITLIGHSRGGGIVTIKAAEDRRVYKVISWAGVSDYENRFPKGEAMELWKENGVYYVENGRTKQQMPHYFQFYTSFIKDRERLRISRAVNSLVIPQLILHGTEDPTVSMEEAKDLHKWNPESELFFIDGADHVFGARHPWTQDTMPEHLLAVVTKSIDFAIL